MLGEINRIKSKLKRTVLLCRSRSLHLIKDKAIEVHIMAFKDIRIDLAALQSRVAHPEGDTLQAKIYDAWDRRVVTGLSRIFSEHPEDDAALKKACCDFLKGEKEFIRFYTAYPCSEITGLLIKLAEAGADEKNKPLSLLMPGVFQESQHDDYPELDGLELSRLLNTHVLSDTGQYLYPVSQLLSLTLSEDAEALPFNYYYDYLGGGEADTHLTAEAYERMKMHAALTEALVDAKQEYDSLTADKSSLLGQLTLLTQHLSLNSAGGRGAEDNAAAGAYPAIIQFTAFYSSLPSSEVGKIPLHLKQEIDKLIRLSSDPASNVNATETIETCIAMRRGAISGKKS
jgi:hypothetical protein